MLRFSSIFKNDCRNTTFPAIVSEFRYFCCKPSCERHTIGYAVLLQNRLRRWIVEMGIGMRTVALRMPAGIVAKSHRSDVRLDAAEHPLLEPRTPTEPTPMVCVF